jgi:hypothetical protein
MSDIDRRQSEMDALLRRSLAGPVPHLSADFQHNLSRELRRRSSAPKRLSRILLAGYAGLSAATSIVVMRGQGLDWLPIAAITLTALATLEAARRLQRYQWNGASK